MGARLKFNGASGSELYSSYETEEYIFQDTVPAENCLECHADLMAEAETHNPAKKKCLRCHVANGEKHPLENVVGFNLEKTLPNLCYECHDPKNDNTFVHEPTKEGKCTLCHSPHSSPNLYLVKKNPVSKLCYECHDLKIPDGNMIHKAVADGDCTGCHNPHQADNKRLFASGQARLCRSCHREIGNDLKKEHVHEPFKNDCLSCHNGHSSANSHLLSNEPPNLCLSCHEEMHKSIQTASLVHGAIEQEKTCLNCHSPHSSDNEKILLKTDKVLCLDCHSKSISSSKGVIENIGKMMKKGNTIHGAIEKEGCIFCHNSHTSEQQRLLNFTFPATSYAPADKENFALCFQCHEEQLFKDEKTTMATNFRNGDKNLHFVHINEKKGRNCNLCHNSHGSANKHLIDEKVKFGNWKMPLNYAIEINGG